MKNTYLAIVVTENNKHHAFTDAVHANENLLAHLKRFPAATVVHLCENRKQATLLTFEWNAAYKANGTNLY